jgi:succinate-semialdehyde dehydrogenase/glutarate-semialdehyde dehydrogenase
MALQSVNPATGEILESFEPHDTAAVDARLDRAMTAFRALRTTSVDERSRRLERAAEIL